MTNDRVIQKLQALNERLGATLDDAAFEAIDEAIEALHRCDLQHSSAEPKPDPPSNYCPKCGHAMSVHRNGVCPPNRGAEP